MAARDCSFQLDGRTVTVSAHAAERYWQRVRPGLPTVTAAAEGLVRVIATAGELVDTCPDWLAADSASRRAVAEIGDDIALALIRTGATGMLATTCMSRHGRSDISPLAARRSQQRQARRRRQARRHSRDLRPRSARRLQSALAGFEPDVEWPPAAYRPA